MNWVRAVAGIGLVFYGTWQTMNGITRALEDALVSIFWANQTAHKRKRAAHG